MKNKIKNIIKSILDKLPSLVFPPELIPVPIPKKIVPNR
jgi:hypothetical protein